MRRLFIGARLQRYTALVVMLLLGLSLGAKLTVWQIVRTNDPIRFLRPDSAGYLDSAHALWEIGRFAVSPTQPTVPQLFRTPGYPAYLATIYGLTGRDDTATVILSQLLLSMIVMGLAYGLCCRLWTPPVAMLALGLLAFDLPSFAYALFVMSETLFTVFLLIALLALLQAERVAPGHAWRWLLLASLTLGVATLVRPVNYYLILPLLLWLLTVGWRARWSWRTIAVGIFVLLLPYGLLVGGWQWRNYQLTGNATFSTVVANNLLLYRGADIIAMRSGLPLATVQAQLQQTLAGKAEQERYAYMQAEGMALLRRYPWLAVQSQLRGALTMLLGAGDGWLTMLLYSSPEARSAAWDLLRLPLLDYLQSWLRERPISFFAFWGATGQVLLVYLGISGWWFTCLRKGGGITAAHLLLWLVILYFVAVSAGPEANSRFRVPLAPLLTGYAAAGITWVLAQRRVRTVV